MIKVTAKIENRDVVVRFEGGLKSIASGRLRGELQRSVIDAGRKTKTQVQRAVHGQMATKSYGTVTKNVRTSSGTLSFEIFAVAGGQRIEAYKGLRAAAGGPGEALERGMVSSGVWNNPRTFQRSFATGSGFFALLPGDRSTVAPRVLWTYGSKPDQPRDDAGRFRPSGKTYGPVRRLFGPSLKKEIVKDQSLATFQRVGPKLLEERVMKRLAKLVRF